ncbi:KH domain-containing protein [Patescibacteria group bacterium]|nr:KH domain-containing protein [Patescibacteria group bacterium]MCL5010335.1 KH domain-containing protein [Patescibacteria group bacterium]
MKNILNFIVSSIADDPTKIEIEEEENNGFITLTVKAPQDQMGRLIGKQGKIIRSIRNVMKIPAVKQNKRVNITLQEFSS